MTAGGSWWREGWACGGLTVLDSCSHGVLQEGVVCTAGPQVIHLLPIPTMHDGNQLLTSTCHYIMCCAPHIRHMATN
jgi:hypothetical protein